MNNNNIYNIIFQELEIKENRSNKEIKWSVTEEKEKYLAKNIWLNGKQKMFYHIGKEYCNSPVSMHTINWLAHRHLSPFSPLLRSVGLLPTW